MSNVCKDWKKNPLVNPETGRKIKKNGPTYKKLKKKCSEKKSDNKDCNKWNKNPLVNPETNRKIKKDGPTYKKFAKKCGSPKKASPK